MEHIKRAVFFMPSLIHSATKLGDISAKQDINSYVDLPILCPRLYNFRCALHVLDP